MAALARSKSVTQYRNPTKNESILNQDYLFRLDLLGPEGKRKIMRDASNLHSFDVCNITQKIETLAQDVAVEKVVICDHYKQLEA